MASKGEDEKKMPTVELKLPTARITGSSRDSTPSSSKQNQQVLFAIPAPRSLGKGMLCMCRQIFYTSGSLLHCAYVPVTKNEATKLLRGPNSINVLQDPKLLTVSASGAIIGMQQTIGVIKSPPPVFVTSKIDVDKGEKKAPTVVCNATSAFPPTVSEGEVAKVPSASPALPQSSTTAKTNTPPTAMTAENLTMPKISAVFSLAAPSTDSSSGCISLASSSQYAFAIAYPKKNVLGTKPSNIAKVSKTSAKHVASAPNVKNLEEQTKLKNIKGNSTVTKSLQKPHGKVLTKEDCYTNSCHINGAEPEYGCDSQELASESRDHSREVSTDPMPLNLTNKSTSHFVQREPTSRVSVDVFSEVPLDLSKKDHESKNESAKINETQRCYTNQEPNDEPVDLTLRSNTSNVQMEVNDDKTNTNTIYAKTWTVLETMCANAVPAPEAERANDNGKVADLQVNIDEANTSSQKTKTDISVSRSVEGKTTETHRDSTLLVNNPADVPRQKKRKSPGFKRKREHSLMTANKRRKINTCKKPLKVLFTWDKTTKDDGKSVHVERKKESIKSDEKLIQAGTQTVERDFGTTTSSEQTVDTNQDTGFYLFFPGFKKIKVDSGVFHTMSCKPLPVLSLKKLKRQDIEELGGNVSFSDLLKPTGTPQTNNFGGKQVHEPGKKSQEEVPGKEKQKEFPGKSHFVTKQTKGAKIKKPSHKAAKPMKKSKEAVEKKIRKIKKEKKAKDVKRAKASGQIKHRKMSVNGEKHHRKISKTCKKQRKSRRGEKGHKKVVPESKKNKKTSQDKKKPKKHTENIDKHQKNKKFGKNRKRRKDDAISSQESTVGTATSKVSKSLTDLNPPKKQRKTTDGMEKIRNQPCSQVPNTNANTNKTVLAHSTGKTSEKLTKPNREASFGIGQEPTDADIRKMSQVMSIDAFTSHPDLGHIPTSDRVSYLKEMLKAQRAALGIKV